MNEMPTLEVAAITIAAPDPRGLAAFYQGLPRLDHRGAGTLGGQGSRPRMAGRSCARLGRTGPALNFEYEAHYVPPAWPSAPGSQHVTEHLDIAVSDLDEAVTWTLEAGAVLAEYQPQESVRVMLDPAGHPFCLFLSHSPQAGT